MTNDLISRSALFKVWDRLDETQDPNLLIDAMIKAMQDAPTVDAVSPGVVEQFKWERDIAIAQLEELGIGFGEKVPDMVEVVRCKDCKHWGIGCCPETKHIKACCFASYMVGENGYCVYGERKMNAEVE